MGKYIAKSKRGGLAADVQARLAEEDAVRNKAAKARRSPVAASKPVEQVKAASKPENASKAKRPQIRLFESSVVRVLMAVGKAGGTFEQAKTGLAKHEIKISDGTIRQNLRNKAKLEPAKLTAEQLATFGIGVTK